MKPLYRLTLHQRLLLVVLLPAALLASAVAGLFVTRATTATENALRERGLAIVSFLAPAAEYGVISGNRHSLAVLVDAVLEQRDVAAVAIYDRSGETLAVNGRLRLSAPERLFTVTSAEFSAAGQQRLALSALVEAAPLRLDEVSALEFGFPEPAREGRIGWVYVELDTRALEAIKRNIVLTTVTIVLVGLLFTAWLAVRLARAVTHPLGELAGAVGDMARGKLDIRIADNARLPELRALQGGFNTMAAAIAEAQQTLQSKVDEATAQLAHQAMHDPLTGLPNRRAFEQALESSVNGSRRAGDRDTLCFIDLDRFKIVNDTCGHAAGDELLRRIARMIRQRVRGDDLLCRIGGDEFALILHGCGTEEARRIAEDLREAVASLRFTWEERRFTVGASIGLVRIDGSLDSASDVLVAADLACYAAKKAGRNRIIEHDHGFTEPGTAPAAGRGISEPIPFDKLTLHGQQIVPINAAGRGSWQEVLLREHGADGELHSASSLLERLEGKRAGLALDLWVAAQACATLGAELAEADAAERGIALNLTRASVLNASEYLAELGVNLRAHGIHPAQIALEFPAATAEQYPQESADFVRAARTAGYRVGLERIDGSSSTLLSNLRPDYVKISLKALAESYGMEAGCNLAQALCSMASALAIPAVASEVEDELFREALAEYGFDHAQGFALATPAPLDKRGG